MSDATENTDRVLWHDESENVFITRGGGLGINCNGHVIVKPLLAWQQLTATIARLEAENAAMRSLISSRPDAPQAFWDENRVAMEAARQRAVIVWGGEGAKT